MKLPGLPAVEQAPGTALDLPLALDPPAALPGHSSSALSRDRSQNPAPSVLPPTPPAPSPSDVSVGDSSAPPLLSYCHGEKHL